MSFEIFKSATDAFNVDALVIHDRLVRNVAFHVHAHFILVEMLLLYAFAFVRIYFRKKKKSASDTICPIDYYSEVEYI